MDLTTIPTTRLLAELSTRGRDFAEPVQAPICVTTARLARIVVAVVADHFELSPKTLSGPSREQPIAFARQVGYALMLDRGASQQSVASAFGRSDHSTVIHGNKVVRRRIAADPPTAALVGQLRRAVVRNLANAQPTTA